MKFGDKVKYKGDHLVILHHFTATDTFLIGKQEETHWVSREEITLIPDQLVEAVNDFIKANEYGTNKGNNNWCFETRSQFVDFYKAFNKLRNLLNNPIV